MSRVPRAPHLVVLALLATAACGDDPVTGTTAGAARADAAPQPAVAYEPSDKAAMQQIVSGLDAAWTAGDAVRYAAFYANAEWVGPDGSVLTDSAAITARYEFVFRVLVPNSRRVSSIRKLTFLTETIAVLDLNATALVAGQLLPGAREKNILIRRGGEWHIVQHQQTPRGAGVP